MFARFDTIGFLAVRINLDCRMSGTAAYSMGSHKGVLIHDLRTVRLIQIRKRDRNTRSGCKGTDRKQPDQHQQAEHRGKELSAFSFECFQIAFLL